MSSFNHIKSHFVPLLDGFQLKDHKAMHLHTRELDQVFWGEYWHSV